MNGPGGAIDVSTPVLLVAGEYGALGAARSLGRLGIEVNCLFSDPGSAVLRSRFLRQSFPWSIDTDATERSAELLLQVGRALARPTVLVPSSDRVAILVAEHAAMLSEHFVFPRQPADLVRSVVDKARLRDVARAHDIAMPRAAVPASLSEARELADSLGYPLLLKGIDASALDDRVGERMTTIRSRAQLDEVYPRWAGKGTGVLLLEEHIPSHGDLTWMFNGYFDGRSGCLLSCCGLKCRQYPLDTGPATLAVSRANAELERLSTGFLSSLGYQGAVDMDWRLDARDNCYKLLDFNPRLGAAFRLFQTESAQDIARLLYLDLTGQRPQAIEAVPGRHWIVEDRDLRAASGLRRRGALPFRRWLASLRHIDEAAWFATDDAGPFIAMSGALLREAAGRLYRR